VAVLGGGGVCGGWGGGAVYVCCVGGLEGEGCTKVLSH